MPVIKRQSRDWQRQCAIASVSDITVTVLMIDSYNDSDSDVTVTAFVIDS